MELAGSLPELAGLEEEPWEDVLARGDCECAAVFLERKVADFECAVEDELPKLAERLLGLGDEIPERVDALPELADRVSEPKEGCL